MLYVHQQFNTISKVKRAPGRRVHFESAAVSGRSSLSVLQCQLGAGRRQVRTSHIAAIPSKKPMRVHNLWLFRQAVS